MNTQNAEKRCTRSHHAFRTYFSNQANSVGYIDRIVTKVRPRSVSPRNHPAGASVCLHSLSSQREHAQRTTLFSNLEHLRGGISHPLVQQVLVHSTKLRMFLNNCSIGTMAENQARSLWPRLPASVIIHII